MSIATVWRNIVTNFSFLVTRTDACRIKINLTPHYRVLIIPSNPAPAAARSFLDTSVNFVFTEQFRVYEKSSIINDRPSGNVRSIRRYWDKVHQNHLSKCISVIAVLLPKEIKSRVHLISGHRHHPSILLSQFWLAPCFRCLMLPT